jgi:uncharacterized RmlC-like cupin family protein
MTKRMNERGAKLHHTPKTSLSAGTAQSSGMRRLAGISADLSGSQGIWMGEAHMSPGSRSEDHHHGDSETGIYVVSGHPVFVFLDNNVETRIDADPGDYVYVPALVPHREENPSRDEEAVVVLARSTQEAIVVNLLGL